MLQALRVSVKGLKKLDLRKKRWSKLSVWRSRDRWVFSGKIMIDRRLTSTLNMIHMFKKIMNLLMKRKILIATSFLTRITRLTSMFQSCPLESIASQRSFWIALSKFLASTAHRMSVSGLHSSSRATKCYMLSKSQWTLTMLSHMPTLVTSKTSLQISMKRSPKQKRRSVNLHGKLFKKMKMERKIAIPPRRRSCLNMSLYKAELDRTQAHSQECPQWAPKNQRMKNVKSSSNKSSSLPTSANMQLGTSRERCRLPSLSTSEYSTSLICACPSSNQRRY